MAISLSSLRRKESPKPPIVVIYGPGGSGKTTFSAGAPSPVLLAVEDGVGTLDVPHWPIANYSDVLQAIGVLYSEEHDRKTLIVDSLDWLEPHVAAETCRRNGWTDLEQPGYGKGHVAAVTVWRELLDGIRALRDDRGLTVVLIAHHTIKRYEDPTTDPYDRMQIKLHDRAGNLVIEAADIVGLLNYRVSIKTTDAGFGKKVSRGVGAGQRVLYLEERPGFIAKSRLNVPASIDMPITQDPQTLWNAFAQHLPDAAPAAVAA